MHLPPHPGPPPPPPPPPPAYPPHLPHLSSVPAAWSSWSPAQSSGGLPSSAFQVLSDPNNPEPGSVDETVTWLSHVATSTGRRPHQKCFISLLPQETLERILTLARTAVDEGSEAGAWYLSRLGQDRKKDHALFGRSRLNPYTTSESQSESTDLFEK